MTPRQKYRKLLDGLRLRHFSAQEILAQADRVRDGVRNSLPPESLFAAIIPTLWVADHARASLGVALTITSAYRSPAYNAAVGGVPGSQHKHNTALDLIPGPGLTPRRLFNRLAAFRAAGMFRGGLGLYRGFVHLDTRGVNATWGARP